MPARILARIAGRGMAADLLATQAVGLTHFSLLMIGSLLTFCP